MQQRKSENPGWVAQEEKGERTETGKLIRQYNKYNEI